MIRLELPSLPPTTNHLYVKTRGGGRALSEEGRKYKTETTSLLQREYSRELFTLKKNVPYLVVFRFWFETLENKGWAKGETSRYKKLDVTNRAKVIEDCLKDAGGFDDSQDFIVILEKRQGMPERSTIWMWALGSERTPFDDVLHNL
jgi:Holliday junction resolvase RusA-like endonuclease